MKRHAQVRRMQACVSPNRRKNVASSATPTESGCCVSRLPLRRPEAGPSHGRTAGTMRAIVKQGSPTLCFCSRKSGRRRNMVPLLSPLLGRPLIDALQSGVSIERQFSRIFPAHPRSLARCFSRARRELRGSASSPAGFGFQKIFCIEDTQNIFQTLRKSAACPWERGTSRHFVQECPGGNPGKYKQEK